MKANASSNYPIKDINIKHLHNFNSLFSPSQFIDLLACEFKRIDVTFDLKKRKFYIVFVKEVDKVETFLYVPISKENVVFILNNF